MELLPFLIFAAIAFNIFKGFAKTSSKPTPSPKTMMQRLNAEIQKASQLQKETPRNSRSRDLTPTQRGRENLAAKGKSPWGDTGSAALGARVAANYLKTAKAKSQKTRTESWENPKQYGRRGQNVDQNRNRTDGWGQRGDSGMLSPRNVVIFLVVGAAVLHVLSLMPAA